MKSETLTLVLVNLAGIMEKADEALLPGVYKEVGEALHTDPTGLGSLTLFRSIVQSLCYPFAAYLSIRYNRTHVIALGAFLWAAATFLVGISSTFLQVAISRGLNGIGLAIVIPAIQSLVADSTDDNNRGVAFGWLTLTGNLGSIIGGLCAVLMASKSFMGIDGWRMAFHVVALVSVIVGVLVYLYANDPRFSNTKNPYIMSEKSFVSEMKELIKQTKSVIRIPSFLIIVAQGIPGSFPWTAMSFATMWLELIGFSHEKTALLWTIYIVSCSLGALFGGKMGDVMAKRFPNCGRIVLAQISSSSTIPLAAILLLALPDDPSTTFIHGLMLFIMGCWISWNGPATNNPIFAEIVAEKSRTSVYALDRSFEGVLSSFAPPIVGLLAQNIFGYKPISMGSFDEAKIETDRKNAASLAKALYAAMGIPMAICCIVYSFLYCTYPRDRDRARMDALVESKLPRQDEDEDEEEDNSLSRAESSRICVAKDRGCVVEDGIGHELDDNEKYFLSHKLPLLSKKV